MHSISVLNALTAGGGAVVYCQEERIKKLYSCWVELPICEAVIPEMAIFSLSY